MAKKINGFQKLINTLNGFEAKRKKMDVTIDEPTKDRYDLMAHWAEYGNAAMDREEIDLAQLIYGKIIELYNDLCTIAYFVANGKFKEHKEAEILVSEREQISDVFDLITSDIYGVDEEESEDVE